MAKRKIRQLTTSNYDFPTLAQSKESKYVDKTDLLYELASAKDEAQYFISRPRRFGKSLMLSTLKAMFEGRRDLFKGLKIYDKPWEGWKTPHPVLHFDMSKLAPSEGIAAMKRTLRLMIDEKASEFACPKPKTRLLGFAFDELIASVASKAQSGKVVILIDEYDSPAHNFLGDSAKLHEVNAFLHDFYCRLKSNSGIIRLLMLTGITKLTKMSVFSGLNHLVDLSMDRRFATLLGYTPQELDGALRENVEEFGKRLGMDFNDAKKEILRWYDGYRFSPDSTKRVVNPVSLGKLFSKEGGKLKSYWETTGSSTLVFNGIRAAGKLPSDLENVRVSPFDLDVCDGERLPIDSLLYQSGYLTIKEVIHSQNPEDRHIAARDIYRLGPPNEEIRASLRRGFISQVLGSDEKKFDTLLDRAKRQIAAGDAKGLLYESLFGLYASVPPDWRIKDESEAKRYFQLFASMCGANPQPEVPSLLGYADAVIETPRNVFVFEFKYKRSSKAAIKQIRNRGYADKWKGDKRPVTLIGVNFNPAQRNIDIPAIEPL